MSLIRCPECGTRISKRAHTCPYCGHFGKDNLRPIYEQEQYEPIPEIESSGEKWDILPISDEDSESIVDYLSKYNNLKAVAPGLAQTIQAMFNNKKQLVADIDGYTRSLIKRGELVFQIDKNGNILPILKKANDSKIDGLIRLKEMSSDPLLINSINNISNQAVMAQILDELNLINEKVTLIQKEMQEDRLAIADSAWDKVMQAKRIEDKRLRNTAILNAINSATDAKRKLMRHYAVSFNAAHEAVKALEADRKAQDAVTDLVVLINCVRIECNGYVFLGENRASIECLRSFLDFVRTNKLDERSTLLKLNENLSRANKIPSLADDFQKTVKKMQELVMSLADTHTKTEV